MLVWAERGGLSCSLPKCVAACGWGEWVATAPTPAIAYNLTCSLPFQLFHKAIVHSGGFEAGLTTEQAAVVADWLFFDEGALGLDPALKKDEKARGKLEKCMQNWGG